MSLSQRVNRQIKKQAGDEDKIKFKTTDDAVSYGIFRIMKEFNAYRLEHFFNETFYSSQYFALLELIHEDYIVQKEAHEKAKRESEKPRRK